MNWLHYLVEANIYLSVFYLFYCLLLNKETHYVLNRVYLLGSCLVSFLIPLMQIGLLKPAEIISQSTSVVGNIVYAHEPVQIHAPVEAVYFTLQDFIIYGYLLGALVVLILLAAKLYQLFKLSHSKSGHSNDSYKLFYIDGSNTAFSFFNYLFIGTKTSKNDIIIRHELVHIRQKHSADIILLEVIKVINWFNPLIYLLANSLKAVHEYIADEQTVSTQTDALAYSSFLVDNAYGISGSSITHSFFNYNLLKKRIIMLNQQRSGNLARLKYLVAVPIFTGLLCASTLSFSKTYGWVDLAPKSSSLIKKATNVVAVVQQASVKQGAEKNIIKSATSEANSDDLYKNKIIYTIDPKSYTLDKLYILGAKLAKQGLKLGFNETSDKTNNNELQISLETLPSLEWHQATSATFDINELKKVNYAIEVGMDREKKILFVHTMLKTLKASPINPGGIHNGTEAIFEAKQTKENPLFIVNGERYTFKEPLKPGQRVHFSATDSVITILAGDANAIAKWGLDAANGAMMLYGKVEITVAEDFSEFYKQLGKTIRYPKDARENKITGKVFASFTVDAENNIQEVQILRGPSKSLNDEMARAITNCKQVAGTKPGVTYTIPVNFALSGYDGPTAPPLSIDPVKSIHNPANTNVYMSEVVVVGYAN